MVLPQVNLHLEAVCGSFPHRRCQRYRCLYCYIAEENSFEIAARYLARIERFCFSLETFPLRGTAVAGEVAGLRRMGFERRVTILFKVGEKRVVILRILYGGQNIEPVLEKLLGN